MKRSYSKISEVQAVIDADRRAEDFQNALLEDLSTARSNLQSDSTQYNRRAYCRAVMTFFDGAVSILRSHVLSFEIGVLGFDEIQSLRQRSGALESAFHSFDLYTNAAGALTPLKKHSKGWQVLKRAVEIRNRITHPASQLDLEISDLDLGHLRITESCIFELLQECLRNSAIARLKQIKMLQERRRQFQL